MGRIKKKNFCEYCKEYFGQGHRTDRCKKLKWPKISHPSDGKIRLPCEYKNLGLETIKSEDALGLFSSGARTVNGVEVTVSGEEYLRSLIGLRDKIQEKIDLISPKSKKINKKFSS